MYKHEPKSCPRCKQFFECKAGDIANCHCSSIPLTLEQTAFIEDRYTDCLCNSCLKDLTYKYTLFKEKFLFNGK